MALSNADRQRAWRERNPDRAAARSILLPILYGDRTTSRETVAERKRAKRAKGRAGKPARPFLAYDGEGVANRYVLLAHSGKGIWNGAGLTTLQCLQFLARWEDGNPIRVFFSGEYDITMMLRDVEPEALARLMMDGEIDWSGYHIKHIPRRIFEIHQIGKPKGAARIYYDTWGFFQSSFLKTVAEYEKAGLTLTPEQRELLEWGKAIRAEFRPEERPQIEAYNRLENELLEQIMYLLREATERVGWFPGRWYGPGAFAELLLTEGRAADLQKNPEGWPPMDAIHRARFGGRIELFQRGRIGGPLYHYDVNSAYPSAIASLPDFSEGFAYTETYRPGAFGLWHVQAQLPRETIMGPLPYRKPGNGVVFPPSFDGWYHAVEVDAAIAIWGDALKVLHGWVCYPERPAKLTAAIRRRYTQRRELKAAGDFGQMAVKLALNASYGKLAQRKGSRRYVNLIAAGYTTAHCRAQLLKACKGVEREIVCLSTDGIISRVPLQLDLGSELGQWEHYQSERAELWLAGIYRYMVNSEWVERKRGYMALNLDQLAADVGGHIRGANVTETRFVPYRLGVAFPHEYGPLVGTWVPVTRFLNPSSGDKRQWLSEGENRPSFMWRGSAEWSLARPVEKGGVIPGLSLPAPDDDRDESLRGESEVENILTLLSEVMEQ